MRLYSHRLVIPHRLSYHRNNVKLFLFAYVLLIFARKLLWDRVRELNRVLYRSISIPVYGVLDVAGLADETNDFSDEVFARISSKWVIYRFGRCCFVRVYAGSLFHLMRFLAMTAICLRRWRMRYTVYRKCIRGTVLV